MDPRSPPLAPTVPLESSLASSSQAAPAQLGPYTIQGVLGQGGMGAVYAAWDPRLGRRVAVKVVLDESGEGAARRFTAEAQAAARLDHPGIVRVHELGEDRGRRFIAMDLVEGESLAARVSQRGPLEAREAARIVRQAAEALAHAHEHGVLHRDLKPHNVLLLRSGEPVVTDFGLAKQTDGDALTRTGESLGTPEFMPPEQIDGLKHVDARGDVYGLGATLYFLVTGRAPFVGETPIKVVADVLRRPPTPPRALRPDLDPGLERLILGCLEKSSADRYTSMRALQEDLDRWMAGEPLLLRRPGLVRRLARALPPRRRAALALTALGLAGGAFLFTRPPPDDCDPTGVAATTSSSERPLVVQARERLLAGRLAEAGAALDEALRREPGSVEARLLRAEVRAARPRPDLAGALEDLDVALRRAPDHAQALRARGALRRRHGHAPGAVDDLRRARELGPFPTAVAAELDAELVRAHVALAVQREREDDLPGVAEACAAALRLDPRCAPASAMAAGARWRTRPEAGGAWWDSDYTDEGNAYARLLAELDAARALDPNSPRVELERARAMLDTDRWEEARRAAQLAVDRARMAARDAPPDGVLDTPPVVAALVRGLVRADEAIALFNAAERLTPGQGDRATLDRELGLAFDELQGAFDAEPPLRGRGRVLLIVLAPGRALIAGLTSDRALGPRSPERRLLGFMDQAGEGLPHALLGVRALGRARHGAPAGAMADLERYAASIPPGTVAPTWCRLAQVLAREHPASARDAVRRALDADPNHAEARRLLALLDRR